VLTGGLSIPETHFIIERSDEMKANEILAFERELIVLRFRTGQLSRLLFKERDTTGVPC